MSADVVNILMFMMIPLIFFIVGIVLVVKGIKGIKNSSFGVVKVDARCIQVDEMVEEGGMSRLYRPIFQYEYQGTVMTASRVEYEYEKSAEIGDYRTITVEKKHPDVIVGEDYAPSTAKYIIIIVMGIMFVATIFEIGLPLLLALIFQVY